MNPFPELVRRYLADEPYRQLSDDDLWARFRDHRDETAFRVLLDRCGARIYLRCRALLGEDGLAEDAFQDTFAELVRHSAKLPGYRAAVAWLYQTATSKALMILRRRRRAFWREARQAKPDVAPAGESELVRWDRQEALAAALVRLPTTQRRAVELVYLEGMTHAETADTLGVERSSIGTHVRRGLDKLRQLLGRGEGLAVLGAVTIEGALLAHKAPLDRGLTYRLADTAWARAAAPAAGVGPWWLGWKPLAAGVVGVGLIAGGVAIGWRPDEPDIPTRATQAAAATVVQETLQERNVRLTAEIAPQLREQLQRFYPPPHTVGEPAIRAVGSEVEVEFQVTPPPPAVSGLATRLRGRYCMALRRLTVHGQPAGETKWYWMNPERPFAIQVPLPLGLSHEVIRGREEFAAAERLFAQLPPDGRAESDQVRALFGTPGGELLLPADPRGVSGFPGGLVLARGNDGLFVRDPSGRWRAAGECPGWFPVIDNGRVFCQGDGILTRRLSEPSAAWEKWCDAPPIRPGEERVGILFVAAGRLHETVKPGALYSRPLDNPAAEWTRAEHRLDIGGLAVVNEELFGHDDRQLYRRPVADPAAAWVPVGPWPMGCNHLIADGDRLLAFDLSGGPIHARPLSGGSGDPWAVVGRVHSPYKR